MGRMVEFPLRLKILIKEEGYTLAFALSAALILILVGAALISLTINEAYMVIQHANSTKAYYLAEAGINHALWSLNSNMSGTIGSETTPVALGSGSYYTIYDSNTGLLISVGKVTGVTRRIGVQTVVNTVPASFQRALTAAKSNAIPGNDDDPSAEDNVFIYNDTTETTRIMIYGTGSDVLNIHGWVINIREPSTSSDYLGYAYDEDGVRPVDNKYVDGVREFPDAHWKEATSANPSGLPTFRTALYEQEIRTASTYPAGNQTWTGTVTLTGGSKTYINGNLTIDGATVTSTDTSTVTTIVAYGNVTINSSTIGEKIQIIAGGWDDDDPDTNKDALVIQGTKLKPTQMGANTELYSNAQTRVYDYVYSTQSSLLSRYVIFLASNTNAGSTDTGNHIELEGVVFSRKGIRFRTESSGREIAIIGSIIAGDVDNDDGRLWFDNIKRRVKLTFRGSAMPSEYPSTFGIIQGVTLDYRTWREQ